MATVRLSDGRVELDEHMTPAGRVALFVCGLFPWLAPYELLVKPRWTTPLSPFFGFALVISLGALGVSALFLMGAFFGQSRRILIERGSNEILEVTNRPLRRRQVRRLPLQRVARATVVLVENSDGPDRHRLRLEFDDGTHLEGPSVEARAPLEQAAALTTTWRDRRLESATRVTAPR